MPSHFLQLGAPTLRTPCFQLAQRNVRGVCEAEAIGLVYGDAGLGKTYAVEAALERFDVEVARFIFPLRTTPKALVSGLLAAVTGIPHEGTQPQLERELVRVLAQRRRFVSIDETQRLNYPCVEMLRHLHDQPETRFALLLTGGNGCHDLIRRYPMLESRIARWTKFSPLTIDEIRALLPHFHPLYRTADPELLERIDDTFADGNLRQWAKFTQAAEGLADETGAVSLTPALVETTLTLVGYAEAH